MRILAVLTEAEEVRKVPRHLMKISRSPAGLDPASLKQQSVSLPAPGAHSVPSAFPAVS